MYAPISDFDDTRYTMNLDDLISGMDVQCVKGGPDLSTIRICDLTEDSRTAVPGSLFIARSGTRVNGNRYIEPAIQCGCVAVLTDQADLQIADHSQLPNRSKVVVLYSQDVKAAAAQIAERFYGNPSQSLVTIGVTGTNGKSTIVEFVHQLIQSAGIRCGLIGTVEIDDGCERVRAMMTTPPAVELSRTLATMVEYGCKAVAMEVSSHAMDQSRVDAVRFDGCAFTNLTGDHLDYHQTFEHYQHSKTRLFGLLKPDGLAAINTQDDASETMIAACTKGATVCGCTSDMVRVSDESIDGMTLEIDTPIGQVCGRVPIFGAFNAMNIFQAVLLAMHTMDRFGHTHSEQLKGVSDALPMLTLPAGRFERVDSSEDDLRVMVDFAHTDDALSSALSAVRKVLNDGSKIWCVFGCGGNRDSTKRSRMGTVASTIADSVVVTSDNPRTELPSKIIDEILMGIDAELRTQSPSVIHVQSDRGQAIAFVIANAGSNDVVLIAGKGHETEQISPDGAGGTRSVHFDDREHARKALRERRLRSEHRTDPRMGSI